MLALRDHRRLLLGRPSPTPYGSGDQFDPAIWVSFVPVLMHGIEAGIIHRLARAVPMNPTFYGSSPRRIGAGLAPVTLNTLRQRSMTRRLVYTEDRTPPVERHHRGPKHCCFDDAQWRADLKPATFGAPLRGFGPDSVTSPGNQH